MIRNYLYCHAYENQNESQKSAVFMFLFEIYFFLYEYSRLKLINGYYDVKNVNKSIYNSLKERPPKN